MTPELATMDPPGEASASTAHPLAVLETKLYSPKWRPGLVSRSRLIEQLRQGADQQLTLVSAPAGFGKTTLLAEWLAQRPNSDAPVGWVSLDRSENESPLFWAYVIRALQRVQPRLGEHALTMLQSARPAPTAAVLTSLINEIDAIDRDVVLVLDDYHVIEAPAVHDGLTFLLDHLPPRMQVIISSRTDPVVPLARLRARGQVTELRAADLRFTPDETSAFLNQVMALDLSATDVATLETRTEGWIAGLKLAALSLKNHGDVQKFIRAFSGDNRYIADYLIQEVLLAQPEGIRRFLLGTAILDRLSGPLCDAVTGEQGSQALLESLEKSNLFVVPLDDTREWYRYHHLFAEVLRAHSIRAHADQVRTLHGRASIWFETNGSPADAVYHAAAADDAERVAYLLERRWPAMDRSYQTGKWLERVKALPDALVRDRPVLNMAYAWALLNAGELESVEARLNDVERLLSAPVDTMVIADEKKFRTLPVEMARARAYLAQALGEISGPDHTKGLLDQIPEGDHAGRAMATALVALAQWTRGELEDAHRTFSAALALMRLGGSPLDAIRGIFVLGDIRVGQGRLHEAVQVYERGIQQAKDPSHGGAAETDELYLGLSELQRERGDLNSAARLLETIAESAAGTEHRANRHRWCLAMARLAEGRGDLAGALTLLDEAETVDVRSPVPRLRPIPALRARIWIAQGRLAEAKGWVGEQRLTVNDDLTYLREFEHITLARVLIARGGSGIQEALTLLERLLIEASRGGRKPGVIEILVLEALAYQALSNVRAALDPLERALALGESEGYLRLFIDEGSTLRELLIQSSARGIGGVYAEQLLRVFDGGTESISSESPAVAVVPPVQILTAREVEILRLIEGGLRNQAIAERLSISTATVKRHVANAYTKLGASHRTEALVRAHELKVL